MNKIINLLIVFFMINCWACTDCYKRLDYYEETGKYYVFLNDSEGDASIYRKRCTGYYFKIHPLEIVKSTFPELLKSKSKITFEVYYVFDLKNKNLHDIRILDPEDTLSMEQEHDLSFTFFKTLEIEYFNTFLNPVMKNARGERNSVKGKLAIEIMDGKVDVF